jgi:hypothetical protein
MYRFRLWFLPVGVESNDGTNLNHGMRKTSSIDCNVKVMVNMGRFCHIFDPTCHAGFFRFPHSKSYKVVGKGYYPPNSSRCKLYFYRPETHVCRSVSWI